MELFFEDVKRQTRFFVTMVGLTILALAFGTSIPFAFKGLAENIPLLAPALCIEGSELGARAIFIPAGMASVTLFCLVLEAIALGYDKSSARKILLNESPSVRTDLFYTFLRISGFFMVFAMLFSFGLLYVAVDYIKAEFDFAILKHTDSIILQYVTLAVVYSFANYWVHRVMHTKVLWEIHKVHHSAEDLNILLPYRNHPVDFIIATLYGTAIGTALGADPSVTILWLGSNAVYQSFVHSSYDWKWRWLEYILITPAAHRIHHSDVSEHYNKNLGILSIWDRMFGTYLPPSEKTLSYGVPDRDNFNTDRFVSEMMACLWRWIGPNFSNRSRAD
jgi:sterol desaturase/sphingolipid hydroxylase (fatty acid hydroxylase superfamily)